jgi:signal transduction histidine kinase
VHKRNRSDREVNAMAKILIVDDKENNLLALRNVLKGLEVETVQATSGDAALRATLNHDFALAILDVQMPAMDGYELAALLRGDQRTRHVPIIFLTAVCLEAPYVFKGYSSGAVDFITKPFSPEILLSKVRVFLELDARKAEIIRQKASLEKLVAQLEHQIEARKKAEQELMKARMLEALGTLAGGIAHDFNNMLAVVLAQIELARIRSGGDQRVDELLGEAEKSVLRATELTSKFITFSGGGSPLKKKLSVREWLRKSASAALDGSNIRYDFSFAQGLWDFSADRRQMDQVIYVLVTNAREAMGQGGTLKIAASNWQEGPHEKTAGLTMEEGPYVKVTITDQGPGIAAENIAKIFDPYYSTKQRGNEKGMGLGLTIAHSIIHKHGGYIQAESVGGAGASFHIYLPALK